MAERSYAPWVDMEAAMRAAGVPLFSVEGHHPAAEFDVIAFNLSAELVYTNVLNLIDLAGVPVRAAERTVDDPVVMAGGHCAFNPEPLADFVDCFVLGDGEEVVGEINEVLAAFRCGPTPAEGGRAALLEALSRVAGRLRARLLRRGLRRPGRLARSTPRSRRHARAGREADHHRPGGLALPAPAAGAAHRGRPRPAQRRAVPGLHPGMPVLPGGHDHPAGARAPGRAGPDHGRAPGWSAPGTTRWR